MTGIGKTLIKTNPVVDKLRNGQPSIGIWISSGAPALAEAEAAVGWDWLLVDAEHSQVGFESMVNCFRAIQLGGCVPLVRVPWNDTISIQRALDAGAMGLVIPMVNNQRDAEFAVGNTVFAPGGIRSFGGSRLAAYLETDYVSWCADNLAVVPQIETVEAVENLEQIVQVPGITCCYVGPSDLALSMGVSDRSEGSEHDRTMQHIADVCRANGMPSGCWADDAEQVNRRLAQGYQFINCGGDTSHTVAGARQQLKAIDLSKLQVR